VKKDMRNALPNKGRADSHAGGVQIENDVDGYN